MYNLSIAYKEIYMEEAFNDPVGPGEIPAEFQKEEA
jgi:hypothetical protein